MQLRICTSRFLAILLATKSSYLLQVDDTSDPHKDTEDGNHHNDVPTTVPPSNDDNKKEVKETLV